MVFVYRANGLAVPIVTVGALVLMNVAVDNVNGPKYYATHHWPLMTAFLIAAALIVIMMRFIEDRGDHFFFVPLRFWPLILPAIGLIFLLAVPVESPVVAETAPQAQTDTTPAAAPAAPEPAPVTAMAVVTPTRDPQAALSAPQPVVEEAPKPKLTQVYADTAKHVYYADDCAHHPDNAVRMSKSVVVTQGYTAAPCGP